MYSRRIWLNEENIIQFCFWTECWLYTLFWFKLMRTRYGRTYCWCGFNCNLMILLSWRVKDSYSSFLIYSTDEWNKAAPDWSQCWMALSSEFLKWCMKYLLLHTYVDADNPPTLIYYFWWEQTWLWSFMRSLISLLSDSFIFDDYVHSDTWGGMNVILALIYKSDERSVWTRVSEHWLRPWLSDSHYY